MDEVMRSRGGGEVGRQKRGDYERGRGSHTVYGVKMRIGCYFVVIARNITVVHNLSIKSHIQVETRELCPLKLLMPSSFTSQQLVFWQQL